MKFFKNIFSRFIINGLLIIIQVAVFIYIMLELSEHYMYIQIFFSVLSYILLLIIINTKTSPTHKIPWLVFIALFPVPGLISCLLFSGQLLPKGIAKSMHDNNIRLSAYLTYQEIELPIHIDTQYKYIENTSNLPRTIGNDIKYYALGEKMFDDIINDLEHAERYIFLEFFILSKGYMIDKILNILENKAKKGILVRIIYDDIGSMKHLSKRFPKKMAKKNIECIKFSPFIPIISGIHNNRNHRKAIIIDGKIAYTGGINLADEYINKISPFGHWKDNGIKIVGSGVQNYISMFLTTWNTYKPKADKAFEKYFNIQKVDNDCVSLPFGDGPKPIYEERVGENAYLNIINKSNKYLYITTPYLIVDYSMTNALRNAALRGVDVRIITPHIPDKKIVFWVTRSYYKELIEAGVKIYEYTPGFIHSKMILADDELAVIGTINFDYRSLVHHFESACLIYRSEAYQDMLNDYKETLSKSHEITLEEAQKINKGKGLIIKIIQIFTPML